MQQKERWNNIFLVEMLEDEGNGIYEFAYDSLIIHTKKWCDVVLHRKQIEPDFFDHVLWHEMIDTYERTVFQRKGLFNILKIYIKIGTSYSWFEC
jgi:hypothetical protein